MNTGPVAFVLDGLRALRARIDHAPLPERVRIAIAAQQASSEILIGWIQLAIVAVFALLFALSPAPGTAVSTIEPEPWFLAAYFVFTLIRLVLAYRRQLPGWLLYVSTVLDMALLLALIWSIHIKYGQPASFYLKAPTLLYVFIFISLRALRYQVRYVLVAGGVAAAGWLLMVLYVIKVDPQNPMITRNYVEYLTSNSVLLGAEFDKVISIVLVTLILAVAIGRARKLLESTVSEQFTIEELARFVPDRVARDVSVAEQPVQVGDGEVRRASILFVDLEGFTALSENLSPTEVIATLNEYFTVVCEPIERHGGVITQFQGDAVLASFNLPDELQAHEAAAIQAACEIQQRLEQHAFGNGLRLRCRIGVNSGEVVGGLVGNSARLHYTVNGDAVNIAARLEQLNKDYGTRIIASDDTLRALPEALSRRLELRPLGEVNVRGRSTPVKLLAVQPSP